MLERRARAWAQMSAAAAVADLLFGGDCSSRCGPPPCQAPESGPANNGLEVTGTSHGVPTVRDATGGVASLMRPPWVPREGAGDQSVCLKSDAPLAARQLFPVSSPPARWLSSMEAQVRRARFRRASAVWDHCIVF